MEKIRSTAWNSRDYLVAVGLAMIGSIRALLTFRLSLGLGDPSTFYIFARNTARGEVQFKDFIHFRMPGFYYYSAAFIKLFGDAYSSLALAMVTESFVLYPIVMFVSAKLLTRSTKIATLAGLACIFVSGIFQLRAGLGLLAIALYVFALRKPEMKSRWLIIAGVVLGLDFLEGQEVFLFAVASIVLVESVTGWRTWKLMADKLWRVAAGALAIIIPFFLYIAIFSNFGNFLYYAFKYALVIQPKFMNLPFPALTLNNWGEYLPILLYIAVTGIFWATRRLTKEVAIVLSFAVLRFATALGRADIAHLIFSVPELFFIVPWALSGLPNFDRSRLNLRIFGASLTLLATFGLAIHFGSATLLLAPIIIALLTNRGDKYSRASSKATTIATVASAAVIVLLFFQGILGSWHEMSTGVSLIRHRIASNRISGVEVKGAEYYEVSRVSKVALDLGAQKGLFSYPIEPFYYSLSDKHASRFITYEFETTPSEVSQSIADLRKNKPSVVIMDVMQAEALSPVLHDLNDYITDNYVTVSSVYQEDYIKVMKRKSTPSLDRRLLLSIYDKNPKNSGISTYNIADKNGNVTDALRTDGHTASFEYRLTSGGIFTTRLLKDPVTKSKEAPCGQVQILAKGMDTQYRNVCSPDSKVSVDLKSFANKVVEIKLQSSDSSVWEDPRILNTN